MKVFLDDYEFEADLVILLMKEFDVILGMDCLLSYIVQIDYFPTTVTFDYLGSNES